MISAKFGVSLICDAGPLIVLGKIDRLDLLIKLGAKPIIPAAVWREVVDKAEGRPPGAWVAANLAGAFLEADSRLAKAYAAQVDLGEAEVLALAACHPDAWLLMDDARGRAIAKASGFQCTGTLGILVESRRRGLIERLGPELDALRNAGWHISDALIKEALSIFSE